MAVQIASVVNDYEDNSWAVVVINGCLLKLGLKIKLHLFPCSHFDCTMISKNLVKRYRCLLNAHTGFDILTFPLAYHL